MTIKYYIYIYTSILPVPWQNFYAVVHMAHTGTIYMTMLVTVERAMVVMKPLRAKYICTRRRAVLVSLGVLVWAVVYNIPRCLEYGTQRIVQVRRHRHRRRRRRRHR